MNFLQGKISKLYYTFLASALGSTLITTVYATVDSIAIGHYAGPTGAAAIACVNPLWPCMLSLSILFGMGGSVMMNNRRGAGNERQANEFFTTAALMTVISSVVIAILFNLFMEEILTFFGAKGAVLEASLNYAEPFRYGAPAFTLCAAAASFVRNDGEAILPTIATAVGGVINVFGDVFFVFDFGLGLGLFGAGLATILGQTVSCLIILSYFFTKKCKLRFVIPRRFFSLLLKISSVGASAAIIEIGFGSTTVAFNKIISENLTAAHLAVYGTASTVLIMFYCFYYAFGSALQPIVSANYGANNTERVNKTLKIALISVVIVSLVFFAVAELFPEMILNIYMDTDEEVLSIGPRIVRLYSLALLVASFAIVFCYYLQSVLRKGASTAVSLLRGVVLPIFFAFLIPLALGCDFIWLAVPLAELVAAVFGAACVFFVLRK